MENSSDISKNKKMAARMILMDKREKKVIGFIFIALLLIGLVAVNGYGINVDENTEIDIARMDLKEYVRLFLGESSRLFQYMDGLIGDLMDSVEIDHGEALLYPIVAVVSIFRAVGRTDLGMLAYHYYLYVWFLFGLLAAYNVGKFLTGKRIFGVAASAFIGLNPLLFGLSFINNKDMVMLSLTSICIWLGIQFVEKKTWKWSVLWAIAAAFCVNMRIIGLAYAGLFGLLYLAEFICNGMKDRKIFVNGIIAVVVMVMSFIAITPATWYSLSGYFIYTISSSTSFLRWHGWELYCGELYKYLENSLPWHYFFVYFGITTPLLFLASIIFGQVGCIAAFKDRKEEWKKLKYIIICAIIIWVPMLFYIIKGANVTFRHFLFMYPPLVFMAVYALERLCRKKWMDKAIKAGLTLQIIACVVLIWTGHPFQTTYFNALAGRNVAERFEYINTDYYKEALERILKIDGRDTILISSDNLNCYFGIKQAWEVLHPDKKARIEIAEPETEECAKADYHVYGYSTLIKENMESKLGYTEADYCMPESKYNTQLILSAYKKPVVVIYYNQ